MKQSRPLPLVLIAAAAGAGAWLMPPADSGAVLVEGVEGAAVAAEAFDADT